MKKKKLNTIKLNQAIRKFQKALDEIRDTVDEDCFNFVGALMFFDNEGDVTDESFSLSIGDTYLNKLNAECLLEDIEQREEEEMREDDDRSQMFDFSLN